MYLIQFLFQKLIKPDQDLVTLITIHSAKGAEQKVCYVPHVSPNQYPHARAQGDF